MVLASTIDIRSHRKTAQLHGLNDRAGNDYDRGILLQPLVEHVHAPQMESDGIVGVDSGRFNEPLRDLTFGISKKLERRAKQTRTP